MAGRKGQPFPTPGFKEPPSTRFVAIGPLIESMSPEERAVIAQLAARIGVRSAFEPVIVGKDGEVAKLPLGKAPMKELEDFFVAKGYPQALITRTTNMMARCLRKGGPYVPGYRSGTERDFDVQSRKRDFLFEMLSIVEGTEELGEPPFLIDMDKLDTAILYGALSEIPDAGQATTDMLSAFTEHWKSSVLEAPQPQPE